LESLGQLAAGVAHEINTPIQYVGDNLRFLSDTFTEVKDLLLECRRLLDAAREGEVPRELAVRLRERLEEADIDYLAEEIPQAVDQTLEGVERVAKIVRSMKEFSHPGTGELTPTDVNKAILSTVTVSRNEWKYVAELETDLAEDLPQVHCIPGEFNQVLLNLIVNAAQAIEGLAGRDSEDRGTIVISTHRCDDEVEIRVRDSGTGIPVEARSKIFDPFFTTKEVGRGTGQGLAIAHAAITKKHGGSIRFETELGKGTTFIVRLPIERPPEA
ncbi:MAG: sensor histidine kinase, partial [Planctomycetota bacterium]